MPGWDKEMDLNAPALRRFNSNFFVSSPAAMGFDKLTRAHAALQKSCLLFPPSTFVKSVVVFSVFIRSKMGTGKEW